PWKVSAKVKEDHASAKLEQIEASYGLEDAALKLAGAGEVRFGVTPLLHAGLSTRQLDADRFAAREIAAGDNAAKPSGPRRIEFPIDAKSNGGKDNAVDAPRVLPLLR